MHVVVQDSLTLIAIAIVYTLAALQLRPFFGVYLTKHVILGVPLFGALVRYRLHYVLKSEEPARAQDVERGGKVQDVARSDEQGRRGITYPAMLRRVSKIEGWAAHFKGLVPTLIPFVVTSMLMPLEEDMPFLFYPEIVMPQNRFGDTLVSIITTIFHVPVYLLIVRAVTVTQPLPFLTNPRHAMGTLFTPSELSRPFAFILSPTIRGITICLLLRQFFTYFIYGEIDHIILSWINSTTGAPIDPAPFLPSDDEFPLSKELAVVVGLAMGTNLLVQIGRVILLCPFEIIAMRLAAQRVYDEPCEKVDDGSNSAKFTPAGELTEKSGTDTLSPELSALAFRSRCSTTPYDGLMSCLRLIIKEEGFGALWRGWWITLISLWFLFM